MDNFCPVLQQRLILVMVEVLQGAPGCLVPLFHPFCLLIWVFLKGLVWQELIVHLKYNQREKCISCKYIELQVRAGSFFRVSSKCAF